MDIGHATFVDWAMSERPDQFYAPDRWPGWEQDAATLGPDQVISMWPPVGFKGAGRPPIRVAARSRHPVPVREQWNFMNDLANQIARLPPDAPFRVVFAG